MYDLELEYKQHLWMFPFRNWDNIHAPRDAEILKSTSSSNTNCLVNIYWKKCSLRSSGLNMLNIKILKYSARFWQYLHRPQKRQCHSQELPILLRELYHMNVNQPPNQGSYIDNILAHIHLVYFYIQSSTKDFYHVYKNTHILTQKSGLLVFAYPCSHWLSPETGTG